MSATLPAFSWGLGVEDTFIPQTRPGLRALDEYELTNHYRLYRQDFDLLADVGAQHLRWGVPWYKVNPAPGLFEWGWMDDALDHLVNKVGCIPIIDLMHYGVPLWMDNAFINNSYAERNAEYAFAFAERYRELVRYYTPLNEPMVNALFCGRLGQWPPHLSGDDGYVKVMLGVCKGVALTEKALRAANSQSVIVQVEAVEIHTSPDPQLAARVAAEQAQVFLPYDLFTGRVDEGHMLLPFLRANGVGDETLRWFHEHPIDVDIFGVNYYPISGGVWRRGSDGQDHFVRGVTFEQLGAAFHLVWDRYQLPMMLTETAIVSPNVAERMAWMDQSVGEVRKACAAGLPVVGYTWWPLFDMIHWDYRLESTPLHRFNMPVGLFANKFAETEQLNQWSSAHGQWGPLLEDVEQMTRERTPLADHFKAYATGAR